MLMDKSAPGHRFKGYKQWCMENSMEFPQMIKNRTLMWSSTPTSGYLSKIIENTTSKKYLHSEVHYSIINNSQGVETN